MSGHVASVDRSVKVLGFKTKGGKINLVLDYVKSNQGVRIDRKEYCIRASYFGCQCTEWKEYLLNVISCLRIKVMFNKICLNPYN